MLRTTIMLPESLKMKAQHLALKKGVSLGELIRESLEQRIETSKSLKKYDPFFDDVDTFKVEKTKDLAKNHDRYLYE